MHYTTTGSDKILKPHPTYPVLVSACGTTIKHIETGHVYKQRKTKKGYLRVTISQKIGYGSIQHSLLVHRLVAETWIPNPYNKPEVDHKDRVRDNPHKDNLRWATRKQNLKNRRFKNDR